MSNIKPTFETTIGGASTEACAPDPKRQHGCCQLRVGCVKVKITGSEDFVSRISQEMRQALCGNSEDTAQELKDNDSYYLDLLEKVIIFSEKLRTENAEMKKLLKKAVEGFEILKTFDCKGHPDCKYCSCVNFGQCSYGEWKHADRVREIVGGEDVEPVKHGCWFGTVCTYCGESTSDYYDCDYCPKCGAKMDGGAE